MTCTARLVSGICDIADYMGQVMEYLCLFIMAAQAYPAPVHMYYPGVAIVRCAVFRVAVSALNIFIRLIFPIFVFFMACGALNFIVACTAEILFADKRGGMEFTHTFKRVAFLAS